MGLQHVYPSSFARKRTQNAPWQQNQAAKNLMALAAAGKLRWQLRSQLSHTCCRRHLFRRTDPLHLSNCQLEARQALALLAFWDGQPHASLLRRSQAHWPPAGRAGWGGTRDAHRQLHEQTRRHAQALSVSLTLQALESAQAYCRCPMLAPASRTGESETAYTCQAIARPVPRKGKQSLVSPVHFGGFGHQKPAPTPNLQTPDLLCAACSLQLAADRPERKPRGPLSRQSPASRPRLAAA